MHTRSYTGSKKSWNCIAAGYRDNEKRGERQQITHMEFIKVKKLIKCLGLSVFCFVLFFYQEDVGIRTTYNAL